MSITVPHLDFGCKLPSTVQAGDVIWHAQQGDEPCGLPGTVPVWALKILHPKKPPASASQDGSPPYAWRNGSGWRMSNNHRML